jgi:hypothetical protein
VILIPAGNGTMLAYNINSYPSQNGFLPTSRNMCSPLTSASMVGTSNIVIASKKGKKKKDKKTKKKKENKEQEEPKKSRICFDEIENRINNINGTAHFGRLLDEVGGCATDD